MKILHVLRSPTGGLFRHVVDLAGGQIARGHEVGVIADSMTGNSLSDAALAALTPKLALGLHRIPIRRNPHPADFVAVWRVARRIHDTGAEIVHGHGAKGGALARLAPVDRSIVRAYTPHGGSLHDDIGSLFHIWVEQMLMPSGQLYLFESAYSCDAFRRKVGEPTGTVSVVHNGIRPDEFAPVALAADASDIVYLGELRALKGVDVLIDAIAAMHRNGRKVTARLVGDGTERAELEAKVAQLGLTDFVQFSNPRPTREALALGRIVVLPSRAESLPYVALEAVAAAKPLVATKVGGVAEIFGPYADRLVASGDCDALTQGITAVIDRPDEALEIARALRIRVGANFSVDTMVDSIVNVYQQARTASRHGVGLHKAQSYARPGLLT